MSVPPVSNPNRDLPAIMDREEVLIVARLAEQSEQYDDMIGLLKPYIESKTDDLDYHERAILSIAFKNAVGMRRIAFRAVQKAKEIAKYDQYTEQIEKYQSKLEEECVDLCKEMLSLITTHLLPKARKSANSVESEVYFLKL